MLTSMIFIGLSNTCYLLGDEVRTEKNPNKNTTLIDFMNFVQTENFALHGATIFSQMMQNTVYNLFSTKFIHRF
jgi:hypothetical protein